MRCAGCGKNLGNIGPVTEIWHEFCGGCNERYCREQEELAEMERQALIDRLGEDGAMEAMRER